MQPVRSVKNQYRGVNAHLHSQLQQEGGWSDFHAQHIIHVANALKVPLRTMGYSVGVEESLQIKRLFGAPQEPASDVLIYNTQTPRPAPTREGTAMMENPTTIAELLAEEQLSEKPFRALVISDVKTTRPGRGKPVAWLELLSPSNKGNSADARFYQAKRLDVLAAGLVFVEIDYLHETPPTFPTIVAYRSSRKHTVNVHARPYHIFVLDPRHKFEKGPAWVKSFDVDQPIPPVTIPLTGNDVVTCDFGVPYAKTFEEGFLGDAIDYSQFPVQFGHYHGADQTRIARRMLAVLEAAHANLDLETGPFPVSEVDLETALKYIEMLKKEIG